MKILSTTLIFSSGLLLCACSGGSKSDSSSQTAAPTVEKSAPSIRGIGEVKHVDLTDPVDEQMIKGGKMIFDMKCSACHKLTDQRVVGPGWAGITNRRTPEWIMNMATNVDMMLEKDPQAQALLEQCLVRMPNQHLSVGDARNILEFMRKNDVEQTGKKDQAKAG
jgi:Cytochrome c